MPRLCLSTGRASPGSSSSTVTRVRAYASRRAHFSSISTRSRCETSSSAGPAIGWRKVALVDSERVFERIRRLDSLLGLLEDVRTQGEETYIGDLDARLRTERALQLALQIV